MLSTENRRVGVAETPAGLARDCDLRASVTGDDEPIRTEGARSGCLGLRTSSPPGQGQSPVT